MAVHVQITGQPVGRTWLYEKMKRQGQKTLMPTYRLVLSVDETDSWVPDQYFAVTRDSSLLFGGVKPHYGTDGECPPSRTAAPYRAVWHCFGNLPNALRLYEPGITTSPDTAHATIRGIGPELRRGVLIHHGPAMSAGCFCLSGGKPGWQKFLAAVRQFENLTRNPQFYVHVLPRHFGADNPLSCP
jgi:hypothetical protein